MSIAIQSVVINYTSLEDGYYKAEFTVTTTGDALDHLVLVSNTGGVDITNTLYASPANNFIALGFNTFGSYSITIGAVAINSTTSDPSIHNIEIMDRWAPSLDVFSMAMLSNSLVVDIGYNVSFVNADVTSYEIGLSEVNDHMTAVWGLATNYEFTSQGHKVLYAWARDTAGNISLAKNANVYIDTDAPIISFAIPSSSITKNIVISNFVVNDNSSLEYAITTTNEVPNTWLSAQPTSIVVDDDGEYTFYCWVKDVTGNIGTATANCNVTLVRPSIVITGQTTSNTPNINIQLEATDIYGISGYYVSYENSVIGAYFNPIKPLTFTFTGLNVAVSYTKTIYAWAINAIGNTNKYPVELEVEIYIPDITAPSITTFSMPLTSIDTTVPIMSIQVDDNVAVVGYFLSELNITPPASSEQWLVNLPTEFIFSDIGLRRVYLWVKDAAGNISDPAWANISIADSIKPTITSFSLPTTFNLLTVPISSLTATDNNSIAGYYISDSNVVPESGSYLWLSYKPVEYKFLGYGNKTVYATVIDISGNTSDTVQANCNLIESAYTAISNTKHLTGKEQILLHLNNEVVSLESIYKYIYDRMSYVQDVSIKETIKLQVFNSIIAYRVVTLTQYGIKHATINDCIFGIALEAGEPGDEVLVQFTGIVTNSLWLLTAGDRQYLGNYGNITTDTTDSMVGLAITITKVLLGVR